jgi:hypothetical protein
MSVAAMRCVRVPSLDEDLDRDLECRRRRESPSPCLSLRGGDHELERILEGAGRPRSRRSSYPFPYPPGGEYARGWYSPSALASSQLRSLTYRDFIARPSLKCLAIAHHYCARIRPLVVGVVILHVPRVSIIAIVLSSVRSIRRPLRLCVRHVSVVLVVVAVALCRRILAGALLLVCCWCLITLLFLITISSILCLLSVLFLLPSWQMVVDSVVVLVGNLINTFESEFLKKKLSVSKRRLSLSAKCAPPALHSLPWLSKRKSSSD